jgi:UDP:flavonoid glycosyltransferase YjiC (YdhE family)
MLALGEALRRLGHEVVVLSQPSVADRATVAGCDFEPFSRLDDYDHRVALEAQLDRTLEALVGTSVGADLVALDPDLAVVDANLTGAAAAAEALGLPSAILLHSVYATYVDTWFGDLWPLLESGVNGTREHFGVAPVDGWPAMFERHERVLSVVPEVFDDHPGQRHFGFLVPSVTGAAPPWPDGDGPRVLVGLSTTYQAHEPVLQAAVDALGAMDVRAIVTTGRSVDPDAVDAAPHVAVHGHVPHGVLLPDTDLVVTHAGMGTVAAALHHGVPLVCTPIDRDQPWNAARVEALGAGLVATPDTVGSAIDRVLGDPSFRDAAARVAAASRAEGGPDAAAADLTSLLDR